MNPNIVKKSMYNGFSKKVRKSLKMDLNISKYTVFHGDFESAVQINPSIAQTSKKGKKLNRKLAIGGSADWAEPISIM